MAGDSRPTAKDAPVPRVLKTILDEIRLIHPDFVLWTGDTVYGYCDTEKELRLEIQRFVDAARETGVPIFNAPGNHEIHFDESTCVDLNGNPVKTCKGTCAEQVFISTFGPLYGSFDHAGAHFVAIDAEKDRNRVPDDEMIWLEGDLERAAPKPVFVFGHTELYSSPLIDDDAKNSHPPIGNRDDLHRLFSRHSVKVVFSGHEHLYWRESAIDHDGIDYFVAGGAGAPFYAQPQSGGFSHYLLVHLSGGKIGYRVIEPGHVYLQAEQDGKVNWIVNSNDTDIAIRGADLKVPMVRGDCHRFKVAGEQRDRQPLKIDFSSCRSEAPWTHFILSFESPKRSSLLLTVRPPE